jgi:phosphatidylglycerophosphatase A
MQKISKSVATLLFIGYVPNAPGTAASLAALGLYLLVKDSAFIHSFLTVFFLILGFWSTSTAEKDFSQKDPPEIVIDEFSAMLLAYLFVPFSPKLLVIGFILFRYFDISKILPIKKLEGLPSGAGIMLDDIAAAILTNLILQVLKFVIV